MGRDVAGYNSALLPHGTWRALWNMRGGELSDRCVKMMLVDDSFQLLCRRCCWEREQEGRGASEIRSVLHSSDDVMFRRHKQQPPSPLSPLFSARFLCSPPFFSGAQNRAFWLVDGTTEMLRISTNQGLGAPFTPLPQQPHTTTVSTLTRMDVHTLVCLNTCVRVWWQHTCNNMNSEFICCIAA